MVIVDEVGKMELFSQSFISSVRELFSLQQATILATVPLTKQRPILFVDELKNRKDVTLIEVRCMYILLDYFHSLCGLCSPTPFSTHCSTQKLGNWGTSP